MDKLINEEESVIKEMEFDCDILITDPCYIIPDDEWRSGYYILSGIRSIQNSTLYGDWSCTVWKANNSKECTEANEIGEFCADAGLVVVADYNAVKLRYPEVEEFVNTHPWCATVIKGFKGTVKMLKVSREFIHENSFEPDKVWGYKQGDKYLDESLELLGEGNINWIARQTGL